MPLAGHDSTALKDIQDMIDISTPMPLAGHDDDYRNDADYDVISTPMPLAGHDVGIVHDGLSVKNFYSHAPRGA